MQMGCVSCRGPLGEGSDFENFTCKPCKDRKDQSELKRKKIFEWQGKLEEKIDMKLDEHLGKEVIVEIYEVLEKDQDDYPVPELTANDVAAIQAAQQVKANNPNVIQIPTKFLNKLTE